MGRKAGRLMSVSPPDFEGLLRRVGAHFELTPTDCLRLQRTSVLLVSRGIALESPEALPWLAPVVCRSPAEQQHFYESFAFPVPHGDPEGEETETGVGDDGIGGSGEDKPTGRNRRWLALGLVIAALILVIFVLWLVGSDSTGAENGFDSNIVDTPDADLQPLPPDPPPGAAMATGEIIFRVALASSLLAAFLLGWRALARRSRLRLKRVPPPDTSMAEQSALAAALPNLFSGTAFRHGLGALRRHQAVGSGRLHIGRTIRATIRTGGRPVLRYGMRPRTPEYVLLADRQSPQDHLPLLADILAQRMAEEKVNATHYEFYADPRRLKRISPDPDPSVKRLPDLFPSHPGARLMMVAERRQCLDRHGRAASWFEYLAAFDRPALLDPGKAGGRPERLPLIDEAELLAVPATSAGILSYARTLSGGPDERRAGGEAAGEDLPQVLERRRSLYLDDLAPAPAVVGALLEALAEWLGPQGVRLLRMTALHPLVDAGLTVFLGSRGSPPLLDETVLLRISRLPWFRTGIFPRWLRLALIRGLAAEDLEFGIRHVQAYLTAPSGDLDEALRRADDEEARRAFVTWLRANPGSEFHDPILVDALLGKPPEEIGEDRADEQKGIFGGSRLHRWLAWFWTGAAALAAVYAVMLLVQPPLEWDSAEGVTAENSAEALGNAASEPEVADMFNYTGNAADYSGNAADLYGNEAGDLGSDPGSSGNVAMQPNSADADGNAADPGGKSAEEPVADRLPVDEPSDRDGQTAVARGAQVDVRSQPSPRASISMTLAAGEPFTIVRKARDWWRVRLNDGREGYINKVYVDFPASAPSSGGASSGGSAGQGGTSSTGRPFNLPGGCCSDPPVSFTNSKGERFEAMGRFFTVTTARPTLDTLTESRLRGIADQFFERKADHLIVECMGMGNSGQGGPACRRVSAYLQSRGIPDGALSWNGARNNEPRSAPFVRIQFYRKVGPGRTTAD